MYLNNHTNDQIRRNHYNRTANENLREFDKPIRTVEF